MSTTPLPIVSPAVGNRTVVGIVFSVVVVASAVLLAETGAKYAFMVAIFGLSLTISLVSFEGALAVFLFIAFAQNWYPLLITVGGFNVRLSQFLVFFLFQPLLIARIRGKVHLQRVPYFWFFVALFGAMLISTVLYSPLLKRGLATTLLLGINIAHFVLTFWLLTLDPEVYRRCSKTLAAITIVLVICGVLNVFFLVVDVPVISAALREIAFQQPLASIAYRETREVILRPRGWGTSTGCYMGALGFAALGSTLDRSLRRRRLYSIAALAAIIGVTISLARGPLLSIGIAFIAMGFLLAFSGQTRQFRRYLGVTLGGFLLLLPLLYGLRGIPYVQGIFARLIQITNTRQGSAIPRIYTWTRMFQDVREHPLIGVGADTYRLYMAEVHRDPTFRYPGENFPMEVLHASGLLGFVPYLITHVGIVVSAARRLGQKTNFNVQAAGLLAGFIGLWLGGSTTNVAGSGSAYWVLLAFVAAIPASRPQSVVIEQHGQGLSHES